MCLYSITECRVKSIHIPCRNNAYSPSCYSVQHTFGCMVSFVLLGGVGIPTEEVEWSGCRNRQSTWTPAEQICTTAIWNQRDHGFIWGWEGGWRSTSSLCLWESGSLFRCIDNLVLKWSTLALGPDLFSIHTYTQGSMLMSIIASCPYRSSC